MPAANAADGSFNASLTPEPANYQSSDAPALQELSDKDKPWDKHRGHADRVQDHYWKSAEFENYARRVSQCSQLLEFKLKPDSDAGLLKLKLSGARFCRVRHCPVCQWRRSLMWKAKAYKVLPKIVEKYPKHRLSDWVTGPDHSRSLKLPSGKLLRVTDLTASDGNDYSVIEASDWFVLAIDLLINPGRTGKGIRAKLGDFLTWFAVKGFYAETYVALKGVYTAKDSRATTQWLEARQLGVPVRKLYTDLLQAEGCSGFDFGNWTNRIYEGLFGMPAKEMKEEWKLMAGSKRVARNYIPEALGLDAVRYCEDMVVRMFIDDLTEAHDAAIDLTRRKYQLDSLTSEDQDD